jgi:3-hydroxyacyl-[acyl-carrier-protein] dehydratase
MRLEYFQMVDRISLLDPAGRLARAQCRVPEQSPVFEGHFPGHPLLPGVLMIETMAQIGGWLVLATLRFARMPFLAQVKEAKLRTFVYPARCWRLRRACCMTGPGLPS